MASLPFILSSNYRLEIAQLEVKIGVFNHQFGFQSWDYPIIFPHIELNVMEWP
jgi:hypothetical protein